MPGDPCCVTTAPYVAKYVNSYVPIWRLLSTENGGSLFRRSYVSAGSFGGHFTCGVCRFLAAFWDRFVSLVADDEDAGGGFDDVVGDGVELVDLEYAVDREC